MSGTPALPSPRATHPTLRRVSRTTWEIPSDARPDMRVPARVFADEVLLDAILGDRSLEQLQNVATLPELRRLVSAY